MPQPKPNWTEEPPRDWGESQTHRVAQEIRRLRGKRSAQWLADRTKEIGFPVSRTVISDLENGRRRYVTTAELIVLAAALNAAPLTLIYPPPYDQPIEVIPAVETTKLLAVEWFSGANEFKASKLLPLDNKEYHRSVARLHRARQIKELEDRKESYLAIAVGPADEKAEIEQRLGVHIERILASLDAQIDEMKKWDASDAG